MMKKTLSLQIIAQQINDIEKEIQNCEVELFSQDWFHKKYKEKLLLQKKMIELELQIY